MSADPVDVALAEIEQASWPSSTAAAGHRRKGHQPQPYDQPLFEDEPE